MHASSQGAVVVEIMAMFHMHVVHTVVLHASKAQQERQPYLHVTSQAC